MTSSTGIAEIDALDGGRVEERVADWVERRLGAGRTDAAPAPAP